MVNQLNASSYYAAVQADFYSTIPSSNDKTKQATVLPSVTVDNDGNCVWTPESEESVRNLFREKMFHNIINEYNRTQLSGGFDATHKPINIRDAIALRDRSTLTTLSTYESVVRELYGDGADVSAILAASMEQTNKEFSKNGISFSTSKSGEFKMSQQKGDKGYITVNLIKSKKDTTPVPTNLWSFPVSPLDPNFRNSSCVIDSRMKGGYIVAPVTNVERNYDNWTTDKQDNPFKMRTAQSGSTEDYERARTTNLSTFANNLMFCPQFMDADYPIDKVTDPNFVAAAEGISVVNAVSVSDVLGVSVFKPYCDKATMGRLTDMFTMSRASSNEPLYKTKFKSAVKGSKWAEDWNDKKSRLHFRSMMSRAAEIVKYLNDNDIRFDIKPSKNGTVVLECHEIAGNSKKNFNVTVMDIAGLAIGVNHKGNQVFASDVGSITADGVKYEYTTYRPASNNFKSGKWRPTLRHITNAINMVRNSVNIAERMGGDKSDIFSSAFRGAHNTNKGQYFVMNTVDDKGGTMLTMFASDTLLAYENTQLSGFNSVIPEKSVEEDISNSLNVAEIISKPALASLTSNSRFALINGSRIASRDHDSVYEEDEPVGGIKRFMTGFGPLTDEQIAIVNALGHEYGSYDKYGHLIDGQGNIIDDRSVLTTDENSRVLARNKETGEEEYVSTLITLDDIDFKFNDEGKVELFIKPDTKSISPYFDSKYRVIRNERNQISPNYGYAGNMLVSLINKARVEVKKQVNLDGMLRAYNEYNAAIDRGEKGVKFEFEYSNDNAINLLQKQYARSLKSLAEGRNTAIEYTKWDCTEAESLAREEAIKAYITDGTAFNPEIISDNDILILDHKTYVENVDDDEEIRKALENHLESYCNEYFGNPFEKRILPNGNVAAENGRFSPHRLKELVNINIVQNNSALPAIHTLVELMQLSGLDASSFTEDAVFANKFTKYEASLDYKDLFDIQFSGTFDEAGDFHMDPDCMWMQRWYNWKSIVENDANKAVAKLMKNGLSAEEALAQISSGEMKYRVAGVTDSSRNEQSKTYGRAGISFLSGSKFSTPLYAKYSEKVTEKIHEKEEALRAESNRLQAICPVNDPNFDSIYKDVGKWVRDAVISTGGELEQVEIDGKSYFDINIDTETGIICYKYRKNTNSTDGMTDTMTGYIGPVFMPETITNIDGTEIEVIRTRFNSDKENGNTKIIVPGYEAYISAEDVSHTTTEERVRLIGFKQRLRTALTARVKQDCISDNMTRAIMSDRSLDSVYSNVADTSYNVEFFNRTFCPMEWEGAVEVIAEQERLKAAITEETDPNKKANLVNDLESMKDNRDLFAAKVRQAGNRVRLPNEVKEQAALHAKTRFESLPEDRKTADYLGRMKPDMLELADFNDLDQVPDTSLGYFDMEIIGQAKNQSCVRYLCEGAKVAEDGSIICALDTEEYQEADEATKKRLIRSPLHNNRYLRYSDFNPQDRIQMAASQLMDATGCLNNVTVAQLSIYGFGFDDGIVARKSFAERAQIHHGSGVLLPQEPEDKDSDCNGNKGVISIVVDPDWTDEQIDEMKVHRRKKEALKKLRDFFKANPTVDVVMAPGSALSRFNAGLGRSLIDNQVQMRQNGETTDLVIPGYDGQPDRVIPGAISRTDMIVTTITAEAKVHVYDAPGEGRKMSGLLGWAFMSNGCEKIVNNVYKNSDAGIRNFTEGLRGIGLALDEDGRFIVDNTPIEEMNTFDAEPEAPAEYFRYNDELESDVRTGKISEETAAVISGNSGKGFDNIIFDNFSKNNEFIKFYQKNGGAKSKVSASEYREFIGRMIAEGKELPAYLFSTKIKGNAGTTKSGKDELLSFTDRIHTEGGYIKCPVGVWDIDPKNASIGNYIKDDEGNTYLPVVSPSLRMDMIQTLNANGDEGGKTINTLTTKNDISSDYIKLYNFVVAYNERRDILKSDANILKSLRINANDSMTTPVLNQEQVIEDAQYDFNADHGINNSTAYGDSVLLHTGAVRFADSEASEGKTVSLEEWTESTVMRGFAMTYDENGMPSPKLNPCYNKFTEHFVVNSNDLVEEPDIANGGMTVAIQRTAMSELMKNNRDIADILNKRHIEDEEEAEFQRNLGVFFKSACGLEDNELGKISFNKVSRARLLNDDGSVNITAVQSLSYLASHDRLGGIFKKFAEKQFLSDGLAYCDYNFLTKDQFAKKIGDPEYVKTMITAARTTTNRILRITPEEIYDVRNAAKNKLEAISAAASFHNIFSDNTPSDELMMLAESSITRMTNSLKHGDMVKGQNAELFATVSRLRSTVRQDQNSMISLGHGIRRRWSKITDKILDAQFNGKKNGIRNGIVPKRMDLSATSVICEDPSLPVDALGMSATMMKKLKLRSYEESLDRVHTWVKNAANSTEDVDKLVDLIIPTSPNEKDIIDTKDMIEELADYCRTSSVKDALWQDVKEHKDVETTVNTEMIQKARELREKILDRVLTDVSDEHTRDKARFNLTKLAKSFSTSRDHVVIWRDPVLRSEGVKYLKVYRDDMVKGTTINPVMDKGFDMDYDGDCIGMRTLLNPALHKEALENLTISGKNISDGRDISYEPGHENESAFRVYKTIMQDGLDLASAESKGDMIDLNDDIDLENAIVSVAKHQLETLGYDKNGEATEEMQSLLKAIEDAEHHSEATLTTIRSTFTVMASDMRKAYEADHTYVDKAKSETCVKLMNLYAHEALLNECGTDCARYDSLENHVAALSQMIQHGVKGSNKKLKSYLQYMGVENLDNIIDADGELHLDQVQGLMDTNTITQDMIRGTQKAQSVKSVGTGVAGELTIEATKEFFDFDSKSGFLAILDVAQLTSQITQSTLQAKHDPVEAIERYKAISGAAKDMFEGHLVRHGKDGWYVNKDEDEVITPEEWVDSVVAFYEAEDGLNIKPVNRFNIENLAHLVFTENKPEPTAFFSIGYQTGSIMPRLNEAVEEHKELFEGRTKIYASNSFIVKVTTIDEHPVDEIKDLSVTEAYEADNEYEEEEEAPLTFSTVTTKANAEVDMPDKVEGDYSEDSGEDYAEEQENPAS